MDTIAFVRREETYPIYGTVDAIDIVINSRGLLPVLFEAVGYEGAPMPLNAVGGGALWDGRPVPEDLIEHGRRAVLTCLCGDFGCGGISAAIEINDNTVTWTDFHYSNGGTLIPIGPFVFARAQYDDALSIATRTEQ